MTSASGPVEGDSVDADDVDPWVAEMVVAVRDRFGIRGLRGARWMIEQEIRLAEEALHALGEGTDRA